MCFLQNQLKVTFSMASIFIVLFEIDVLMCVVGNPSICGWIFDKLNI